MASMMRSTASRMPFIRKGSCSCLRSGLKKSLAFSKVVMPRRLSSLATSRSTFSCACSSCGCSSSVIFHCRSSLCYIMVYRLDVVVLFHFLYHGHHLGLVLGAQFLGSGGNIGLASFKHADAFLFERSLHLS